MNRIAFTLPDVGLRELRGMVYVDDGYLVLRLENQLLGLFDAEKDVIKIEPGALERVEIERGVFKDRLVLTPKRMDLLDLVPGQHASALELRVWRTYHGDLVRLVEEYETLQ